MKMRTRAWVALTLMSAAGCLGPVQHSGRPPDPVPRQIAEPPPVPPSAPDKPGPAPAVFRLPVANAKVLSKYGRRGRKFHTGIDLRAKRGGGDPVLAAADGCVAERRARNGYGNTLVLRHEGGYMTRYSHLRQFQVAKGQCVGAGEVIGIVGATGNASTAHLHFEIFTKDEFMDPYPYIFKE